MSVNNGNGVYNNGLTDDDVKNIVDNLPEFQAKADKTYVDNKTYLVATILNSSNDLDNLDNAANTGDVQLYRWLTSLPANVPDTTPVAIMMQYGLANKSISKNSVQIVYPRRTDYYFSRVCEAGVWSEWNKCYYKATSTYNKTNDAPVNAIAIDTFINNLFTNNSGDQMTETPPKQYYVTGKFYFVAGKVCRCTAYSETSATFDVYGIVESLNYVLGQT